MRADLLIRDARREAGLTQAQLAAHLGVSQSAIAKLEREGCNPKVETLDRVLRATGHRLQLIAPAWGSAAGHAGPSITSSAHHAPPAERQERSWPLSACMRTAADRGGRGAVAWRDA